MGCGGGVNKGRHGAKFGSCEVMNGDSLIKLDLTGFNRLTDISEKLNGYIGIWWAGIAQSVQRLATGWTVRGSNPSGDEIFRTRPNGSWGPSSLLYNGHRVLLPGVKRPGRGVNHPPPPGAKVKKNSTAITLLPLWAFMVCSRANSFIGTGLNWLRITR